MVEILLNGQKYEARAGETILEVAQRVGIDIPTLCHHPSVKPTGSCRVCLVEFSVRGGSKKLTSSCTYVVEPNLSVETHSERVLKHRRTVLELLQARVPDSPELKKMAKDNDVRLEPRFPVMKEDCILCGLCARVCEESVGANALAMEGRGTDTFFHPPFGEIPVNCVGCGSCAFVCPVSCIEVKKTDKDIEIWGKKFDRLACTECGQPLDITPEHRDLIRKRTGLLSPEEMQLCGVCERRTTMKTIQRLVDEQLTLETVGR